ncbi:hypothetical protein STANM309S_03108 [Streptomyces tanashiensis]
MSQSEPTRYSGFPSNVRDRSQRGQVEPGDGGSKATRIRPAPSSTENRARAPDSTRTSRTTTGARSVRPSAQAARTAAAYAAPLARSGSSGSRPVSRTSA